MIAIETLLDDSSLYYSQQPPCYVEWKRPGEIVQDPLFFEEGHSRFDVIQGELGDCWLLAAVIHFFTFRCFRSKENHVTVNILKLMTDYE